MRPFSRNSFAFVTRNNRSVASARTVLFFLLRGLAGATGMGQILAGIVLSGKITSKRCDAAASCYRLQNNESRSFMNQTRTPLDGPRIAAFRYLFVSLVNKLRFSVYVVLLDSAVLTHANVQRLNPKRVPGKPCVYVGMTGLRVDERFINHKRGHKSARVVKKYGIQLLPHLFEYLNPMPYEAAVQMEKDLAEDLRSQGYTVTGGT
jgi:hypothetical protein